MTRKPKTKSKAVAAPNVKATGPPFSHDLLQRIAVFGDSGFAVLGSFSLLVLAMTVAWYTDDQAAIIDRVLPSNTQHQHSHSSMNDERNDNFDDLYKKLGSVPEMRPARVFSIEIDSIEDIHAAYKEDGVVAVRGLIDPTLLERLDEVSRTLLVDKESEKQKAGSPTSSREKKRDKQFHTMQQHPIFLDFPELNANATKTVTTESDKPDQSHPNPFLEVALLSQVPTFASQLMLPELKTGENVRMLR
jgi:hypothetical protein